MTNFPMSKYFISNFILLALVAVISSCSTEPPADLIVTNAKIYTVDEANPMVEAIAVRDGKIVGLGTSSEIEKLKGDKTKVIDAAGKLVLPGFVDSHIHAFWGGQRLTEVDLNRSKTIEELKNTLSNWITEKQISPGTPIWGVGPFPSPTLFGGEGWPTKEILDEAAPENPVVLSRGGAHALWLNSLALKESGIVKGMPQLEGGEIVFDAKTGEPTGILKENAQDLATNSISHPIDMEAIFKMTQQHANSLGLTSITTMPLTPQAGLSILKKMNNEGTLTLRTNLGYAPTQLDSLIAAGAKTSDGDDMIQTGPIKIFMDGSLGALSAFMYEPFTDNPGNSGIGRYEKEDLNALVEKANANNFQVAIHAIGDKAVTWALDAIEVAQKKSGNKSLRNRVEHNTVNILSDTKRFGELGVVASMQPHITGNQEYREKRLGTERGHQVDMWKTLLENNAMLAWSTDWPVSSLNPIDIIYDIVTRYEEQRLPMKDAIKYYTYGSSYASHSEKTKGTLEMGKLGDMVILSQDLLTIPTEDIKKTEVLYTIVGGKVVYHK
ncbi:MAG: amidohydrolase [Cyclobacteriaceae bacterium]|nr:amidohydrolase [Cyclobacteriaceae bacterium]